MKKVLQIEKISPEDLEAIIKRAVLDSGLVTQKEPESLFSYKQTADFFGVSIPTIYSWCEKGFLTRKGIGNKVYFLRSELIEALKNI